MSDWYKQADTPKDDSVSTLLFRIQTMNDTFELQNNSKVTDLGRLRLELFMQVFKDEVTELNDVYDVTHIVDGKPEFNKVHLADTFGDLLVYLLSECCRWGVPILPVFHAIMDSQESKLVDGKPIKAADGSKFLKGPNYLPPEPSIARILES